MTVSRAINHPDSLRADTLARVKAAMAATGYVPNRLANGLRMGRSRLVAALVPTLSGPIFLPTIEMLTSALAAQGYQLMVGQTGYSEAREEELLDQILARRPDGIVLTGVMHSAAARRKVLAAGIPVVETWDLVPEPIDTLVGFSHEAVGAAVARFLVAERGRRRLAVIGGDDARSLRRARAFAAQAESLGATVAAPCLVPAPAQLGAGRSGLRALLERAPAVDGILCSSDMLALGVLIEAQARGVAVPGQMAVVGFGDLALAQDTEPALTTVRIDGQRIGELTAALLLQRMQDEPLASAVHDVGFAIVARGSA
ncbi:MAG: HTH-type transcriptional regulator GntR [Xylophilus sp.]|nr:MAG: HTH-type transcriptional regulator GntR [Xylophilus sp.]